MYIQNNIIILEYFSFPPCNVLFYIDPLKVLYCKSNICLGLQLLSLLNSDSQMLPIEINLKFNFKL